MVADDDNMGLMAMRLAFRELGVKNEVIYVKDGEEAINEFRNACNNKDTFALVICEYHLPKRDGPSVVQKMQAACRVNKIEMPLVLMVSSYIQIEMEKKMPTLGLETGNLMMKPVDLIKLASISDRLQMLW